MAKGRGAAPKGGARGRSGAAPARGDRRGGTEGRPAKRTRTSEERPAAPVRKGWGSLARRGAGAVSGDDTRGGTRAGGTGRRREAPQPDGKPQARGRLTDRSPSRASETWRAATVAEPEAPWQPEQWIEDEDEAGTVRAEAKRAVTRGTAPTPATGRARRRGPSTNREVVDELTRVAGPTQAPKLGQRLAEATRAYERERYHEARKLLRPLAERAPGSASVRELYGLTLYRLGEWRSAVKELEAFRTISGSTEQHPVLADCYRALRQYSTVEELWAELRASSPSPELVAEGRIVMAGALADRGDMAGAIRTIEQGLRTPKRLRDHHLRLLYALADLRERAGDVPEARTVFRRIAATDSDFADVAIRLRALG